MAYGLFDFARSKVAEYLDMVNSSDSEDEEGDEEEQRLVRSELDSIVRYDHMFPEKRDISNVIDALLNIIGKPDSSYERVLMDLKQRNEETPKENKFELWNELCGATTEYYGGGYKNRKKIDDLLKGRVDYREYLHNRT